MTTFFLEQAVIPHFLAVRDDNSIGFQILLKFEPILACKVNEKYTAVSRLSKIEVDFQCFDAGEFVQNFFEDLLLVK